MSIIIFLFPSICFSKSKTVTGEYCEIYLGDMKNKDDLGKIRKSVRKNSIIHGLRKLDKKNSQLDFWIVDLSPYVEKIVVVSHTERGRKICDKVKITVDPEVITEYLRQSSNYSGEKYWYDDIDDVLTKKSDKINIGLIIETKIPDLDRYKKEIMENKEEDWFHFKMIELNQDKYKVIDRRHLSKILEEQKLSSSGITDNETVRLGKILNLDIIVLRIIYEESKVTKVLKVDTGEVLLFRTYEEKKKEETKKEEGWISFGGTKNGDYYYDNRSMTFVSPKVIKVWSKLKYSKSGKEDEIQSRKKNDFSIDGYNKLDFTITLTEVDCINNTRKPIKYVDYDDQEKILEDYDFPDPSIQQLLPDTIGDSLRQEICPK